MSWWDSVATGAKGFMDNVSTSASSGGTWDTVSRYGTNAFNWLGDNPEAANLLGGIAVGAAQGYMANRQAKDQRAFQRDMYDRSVRDRRKDREIKPGEINDYGSHRNAMTQGLLSHGMIAGQEV